MKLLQEQGKKCIILETKINQYETIRTLQVESK